METSTQFTLSHTRLKELRKAARMTQQDVANAIGRSKGTICKYEKGDKQPSTSRLIALLQLYGVKDIAEVCS